MQVNRIYNNFRGVDFANKRVELFRSPDALNMWKNYGATEERLETRPGMQLKGNFGAQIYGYFFYRVGNTLDVLVHAGTKLYTWDNYPNQPVVKTEIHTGMNVRKSHVFIMNNILFIKDGINYLEYNGTTVTNVIGTVPTTSINRTPTGEGTFYQPINVLQPKAKNTFVATGTDTAYTLDNKNLDPKGTYVMTAVVNGTTLTEDIDFTVNRTTGVVTFNIAPTVPVDTGIANVEITYSKTISGYADRIKKCTISVGFDNRMFFSGNQDYPNTVFHTELDDPRYISDLARYPEGTDLSPVKEMIPGNNALWVVKQANQNNNTIYYHVPTYDSDAGKIYPSTHTNISTGCVTTGINFADDIVFLSERGLEAITGSLTTEQVLTHRSTLIDTKLTQESTYMTDMEIAEHEGYLFMRTGSKVYLMDSRQKSAFESSYQYEGYYWEMSFTPTYMVEIEGNLYFGNANGDIYQLTGTADGLTNIDSYWKTPKDDFGAMQYQKTTNKRGAVVNSVGGSITVRAKKDNGEWQDLGDYDSGKEYFVVRSKIKKWKEIQFEFSSSSSFGLYDFSLEAFVGGYIKR